MSLFSEHIRPSNEELKALWDNCIFAFDTNVLLNLYRYSTETQKELKKAIESVKDKMFLPHQAAKELLRNRLKVTSGQVKEYNIIIDDIQKINLKLSQESRHPFLPKKEKKKYDEFTQNIINTLTEEKGKLEEKLTHDVVLPYLDKTFGPVTGSAYSEEKHISIVQSGEARYKNKIPPGYKDSGKDSSTIPDRQYGDLLLWNQIIDFSIEKSKPIILVTDDKKEDWWMIHEGRTISPRPELIQEFRELTGESFWMYSVLRFIEQNAEVEGRTVSSEAKIEMAQVSKDSKNKSSVIEQHLEVQQEIEISSSKHQAGIIYLDVVTEKPYLTGTGYFSPPLDKTPQFKVDLMYSPYENDEDFKVSFGCGTPINFNIHLRAKRGNLKSGTYMFKYNASTD